jgi:hypothetical protein
LGKKQPYDSASAAIISLHERGYVEDFELSGNELLWIQRKAFLEASEFLILESYCFNSTEHGAAIRIYGIVLFSQTIKGILIKRGDIKNTM